MTKGPDVSISIVPRASQGVSRFENLRRVERPRVIYIGETDNIKASLLNNQQQGDSALMRRWPTGLIFEPRSRAGRLATQDRLILEYEPVCNRRLRNGTGGAT